MALAFLEFSVQGFPQPWPWTLLGSGPLVAAGGHHCGQLALVLLPKGPDMELLVPTESLVTAQCPDRNAYCSPARRWDAGGWGWRGCSFWTVPALGWERMHHFSFFS